ncbi:MAG: serpin family protein [Prevotella sp.]|nr:serpin family protein [Prevotella sp.]
MKKNLLFMAAMAAGCMMMLSCSSDDVDNLDETKVTINMLPEAKPIQLTPAQRVFANDNNGFTLRFLKTVNETDVSGKSFIYSPLSITYVLGMVNDAATGQTERELEQTLGFHEGGIQAVNDYCKNLIDNLPKVDKKVTLNIANAIFVNKHYRLKEQFQKDMQDYYDAQAETLDFSSPETLGHINGWCDDKTNGMIPTILDGVDPDMASYLLNAIYFKADWASKFDPKNTKTETFTTEKGSIDLPMMHQNVLINYKENDTYTAIMMPYGDDYWNMTVMLPKEGKTTDDVINYLAGTVYYKTEGDPESGYYVPYEVDLKLPRFETSSDTEDLERKDTDSPKESGLITLLKKMGIQLAFDPLCGEICNMCDLPVYISMMRQKAKIKVNEDGSEAAAVTVAGVNEASLGPVVRPKATFHANRPFVYVIREASSGVILFVGKYTGE